MSGPAGKPAGSGWPLTAIGCQESADDPETVAHGAGLRSTPSVGWRVFPLTMKCADKEKKADLSPANNGSCDQQMTTQTHAMDPHLRSS